MLRSQSVVPNNNNSTSTMITAVSSFSDNEINISDMIASDSDQDIVKEGCLEMKAQNTITAETTLSGEQFEFENKEGSISINEPCDLHQIRYIAAQILSGSNLYYTGSIVSFRVLKQSM